MKEPLIICSCSNPECMENGCILRRKAQNAAKYAYMPSSAPPMPLTAEEVRRIVREELTRATKENK